MPEPRRILFAFLATPVAALLMLWVVIRVFIASLPADPAKPSDPASWTLFYILLFGTLPAAFTTLVVGVPAYALLKRTRRLSAVSVTVIAGSAGGVVLSVVWVTGFGGGLELPIVLVGMLMGVAGGGAFWAIAGTARPPSHGPA